VTARVFLALFALLLLLPSADYQVFDGVPWSRLPECVGLALLVPFVVSRPLRRRHGRLLDGNPHAYPRHFLIGYLAMGSLVAFAWADHRRPPLSASPGAP